MKTNQAPSFRLKRFRDHVSASQRDLSRIFGVSPGALAMWENETREMSGPALVLLERLEEEFGLADPKGTDASMNADHLSRRLTEKVLANIGKRTTLAQRPEVTSVHVGMKEIVENYLSSVSGTRQLQVSMVERILDSLAGVKGLPLKIIQLASFIDFGLSTDTQKLLIDLQNSVAPMTSKQLKDTFLESFGKEPEKLFSEWDARPIATASIGQVHKAKLPTGEWVAVKVQYPHIYRKMVLQTEIVNQLSLLVSLFRNDYSDMLKDFVKKLREECDYRSEAINQTEFFNAFKGDSQIVIPKVYMEYSTAQVLTSEFIDGKDFRDFSVNASQEEKDLAGGIIHRFNYQSVMQKGLMHADAQPRNYIFLKDKVAFLDFGRVIRHSPKDLERLKEFYTAIHQNNKVETKKQMELSGYVRNWKGFHFEEFWQVIRAQMDYELSVEPVRFTKEYVRRIWRMANSFKQRTRLTMSAHYFWPVFTSAGLWNILAELESRYPWRKNVLMGIEDLKD